MTPSNPSRLANKPVIPPSGDTLPPSSVRSPDRDDGWEAAKKFLSTPGPAAPASPVEFVPRVDLAETFRHSGWMPNRRRVQAAMKAIPALSPRRISAFSACGCDARIEARAHGFGAGAGVIVAGGVDRSKFHMEYRVRSTKCHDRFCVPCAAERAHRIRSALLGHIAGRKNLSLITLTLRASDATLSSIIDRITKAFRLLRSKKIWKDAIAGGCAIIETKIASDGQSWHVHYHILSEAKFIDQGDLSDAWLKITGDSKIVDVRRVGSHVGATKYITNYVTKGADVDIVKSPRHLTEAITGFAGRRLVSTFGTWRGLQLMELPDEDEPSSSLGQWENVGSLHDMLAAAAAGDARARDIVRQLRRGVRSPAPGQADNHGPDG